MSQKKLLTAEDSKSSLNVQATLSSVMSIGTAQTPAQDIDNAIHPKFEVIGSLELMASKGLWWSFRNLIPKYHIRSLLRVELVDTPFQGQTIFGGLYKLRDTERIERGFSPRPTLRILRVGVPGPFPSVTSSPYGTLYLPDRDHALVWIFGHEFCHYLKRSQQLRGKNDEKSACEFADQLLLAYIQEP